LKAAFTDPFRTALEIRHAVESDLPRIVEIHDQSLPVGIIPLNHPPGHPENWETWWESHTTSVYPVWVLEEDGKVVAWISLSSPYRRRVFLSAAHISVYVAHEAQRRGIGTRLVTGVIEACPELGIRTLLAFVSTQNEASLKIFRRAGLEPWGNLPGAAPHPNPGADVVMLGKKVG
jgi:phosphinothricin acetyltransferase